MIARVMYCHPEWLFLTQNTKNHGNMQLLYLFWKSRFSNIFFCSIAIWRRRGSQWSSNIDCTERCAHYCYEAKESERIPIHDHPHSQPAWSTCIILASHGHLKQFWNILNYNSWVAPTQLECSDQKHFAGAPSWALLRAWCPKQRRRPCHTSCCGPHCHRHWTFQCTWRPGQGCIW